MTRNLRNTKQLFSGLIIFGLILFTYFFDHNGSPDKTIPNKEPQTFTEINVFEEALQSGRGKIKVTQYGKIHRILSDDNEGSRHQRFIVKLSSGQTLLIAHNIDLAPRVPDLRIGGDITFQGEYEPNAQGGIVHWTHHDPAGRHVGGWLDYQGKRYQ